MTIISSGSTVNTLATQIRNDLSSQEPKCYARNEAKLSQSRLPTPNAITKEIDNLLLGEGEGSKEIYCVTFIGYSGLGYDDPEALKATMKSELERCMREHPDKQIVVVCGGTSVGIGAVYDVVADDATLRQNIKCIGIVSELASEEDLVKDKQDFKVGIVRVPDPDKSWQTKWTEGDKKYQAMNYPAYEYGGEILGFGAGGVGHEEVEDAKEIGIEIKLFPSKPNAKRLEDKIKDGKEYRDICPLLYHEFGFRA